MSYFPITSESINFLLFQVLQITQKLPGLKRLPEVNENSTVEIENEGICQWFE